MAGTPLATLGDLLRHADLSTTQIYARVGVGYLRDAASKLTPLVGGVSLKGVTQDDNSGGEDR